MTIGVIAACMPAFARFVQHFAPDFNIVENALTLQRRWATRRGYFQSDETSEPEMTLQGAATPDKTQTVELRNPPYIQAQITVGKVFEIHYSEQSAYDGYGNKF